MKNLWISFFILKRVPKYCKQMRAHKMRHPLFIIQIRGLWSNPFYERGWWATSFLDACDFLAQRHVVCWKIEVLNIGRHLKMAYEILRSCPLIIYTLIKLWMNKQVSFDVLFMCYIHTYSLREGFNVYIGKIWMNKRQINAQNVRCIMP